MGSHRVHNHWMYQNFILSLAWWWLVVAETCCQVFNSAHLIHVVSLTVINCYILKFFSERPYVSSLNAVRNRHWVQAYLIRPTFLLLRIPLPHRRMSKESDSYGLFCSFKYLKFTDVSGLLSAPSYGWCKWFGRIYRLRRRTSLVFFT
jgi:hypothetical protein